MVGLRGFEPRTFWLRARYSTQLSYNPSNRSYMKEVLTKLIHDLKF